jgi:serine protease Do
MVDSVEKGSPAEAAGIKPRDIVQKVDGKPVKSTAEVQRIIFPKTPGSKVPVTVWRDGKTLELTTGVRAARDDEFTAPRPNAAPRQDRPNAKATEKPNRLGLIVEAVDEDDKKELTITNGVMITDVSGPAARSGLRAGDAILMVNTTEVKSVAQFNELVDNLDDKRNVALLVKRGEAPPRYITMRPDAK